MSSVLMSRLVLYFLPDEYENVKRELQTRRVVSTEHTIRLLHDRYEDIVAVRSRQETPRKFSSSSSGNRRRWNNTPAKGSGGTSTRPANGGSAKPSRNEDTSIKKVTFLHCRSYRKDGHDEATCLNFPHCGGFGGFARHMLLKNRVKQKVE